MRRRHARNAGAASKIVGASGTTSHSGGDDPYQLLPKSSSVALVSPQSSMECAVFKTLLAGNKPNMAIATGPQII